MNIKRIFTVILLLLSVQAAAFAQKGLQVDQLFGGPYLQRKDATEVLIKGSRLHTYKLTLFRSITLTPAKGEAEQFEKCVLADAKLAIDKELTHRQGHLYYGFCQFKPRGETRRYLFFRDNGLRANVHKNRQISLIYMEGTASPQELKQMFTGK